MPVNIEAACRSDRHGCLETKQRIWNVEVILQNHVAGGHPRSAGSKPDRAYRWNGHSPEESAGIGTDPGIKVVNLGGEILEVILTSVEVQSNEAKCSFMDRSINTDVDAAHEAHVGIEQKGLGAPIGVGGRTGPLNVSDPNETVEVAD